MVFLKILKETYFKLMNGCEPTRKKFDIFSKKN